MSVAYHHSEEDEFHNPTQHTPLHDTADTVEHHHSLLARTTKGSSKRIKPTKAMVRSLMAKYPNKPTRL